MFARTRTLAARIGVAVLAAGALPIAARADLYLEIFGGRLRTGFTLTVNPDGGIHDHLDHTLNAPASDGVYLLALDLFCTAPGVGPSLPFWTLYNQNDAQANVDAAATWVRDNLVPAPGVAAW